MKQFVNSIQGFKLIAPNSYEMNYTAIDGINEITIINQSVNGVNGVYLSINQALDYQNPSNTILQIAPGNKYTFSGKNNQLFIGQLTVYVNHSILYSSGIEYGIFTIIKKQILNAKL